MLTENRLIIAVHLGDLTKKRLIFITSSEALKVDVARYLVDLVAEEQAWQDVVGDEVVERVVGMVEMWKGCESEEIRKMGWELEKEVLAGR